MKTLKNTLYEGLLAGQEEVLKINNSDFTVGAECILDNVDIKNAKIFNKMFNWTKLKKHLIANNIEWIPEGRTPKSSSYEKAYMLVAFIRSLPYLDCKSFLRCDEAAREKFCNFVTEHLMEFFAFKWSSDKITDYKLILRPCLVFDINGYIRIWFAVTHSESYFENHLRSRWYEEPLVITLIDINK